MAQPYLEINNLNKSYGPKIILNIEKLVVDRGEVLAVIGPNGAGKSTLLRLIAHLERPSDGTIRFVVGGEAESELDIRRRLAVVFQESLLFTGTVYDNIAYGLKVRKVARAEVEKRVRDVAEMFAIPHLLDRSSMNLSGGEAQRVSLARALILEPELLLLDEPMASLDPPTKDSLLADLSRILDELETTVLYITHERTEAAVLADRLAVMDEGRIVQIGEVSEVLDYPINRKIADFVGVENILQGDISEVSNGVARVSVNGSQIKASRRQDLGGGAWVCIRPENIAVTAGRMAQKNGSTNNLHGTIENMVHLGAIYRVSVDCGFPLAAFVTRRSVEEMGLETGRPVWVSFGADRVHLVPREEGRV